MRLTRLFGVSLLPVSLLVSAGADASTGRVAQQPSVVVAIVGESGVNLLHEDFQRRRAPGLPSGAQRGPVVSLPTSGNFESRVAASRQRGLGQMQRDVLYRIPDNRIAAVIAPSTNVNSLSSVTGFSGRDPVDVFADTQHGTGVVSALASRRHGTAPDVTVVMVLGGGASAWRWIAQQSWIDMVSVSYIVAAPGASSPPDESVCPLFRESEAVRERGALTAVASTNDPAFGTVFAPAGFPGVYHVGGVRESGEPVIVDAADGGSVTTKVGPDRPYDSGELFRFTAASHNGLSGDMVFGGTSGATPRLVGRAANLLSQARSLVGDQTPGTHAGSLALAAAGARLPARGPLADGSFTASELAQVLRNTSTPHLAVDPHLGYLTEGFGATTKDSISTAARVLSGERAMTLRAEEEFQRVRVESVRQAMWTSRCAGVG